jgi:CUG-BP- and ETR3-like factor
MTEEVNMLRVQKSIGVKLFVGQIPKIWKEEEIIEFFQKFGKVQDAQIIRDSQGAHRGCAFVTFISMTDADIAMRALNETFFLPGSTAKLQLKWADGEDRRLGLDTVNLQHANKLLITGIPRSVQEVQIRRAFEEFGYVRLLKLIHTTQGFNRAYVKYATKEQAISAVKETHERLMFPSTSKTVNVFFAESKRINKNVPFGQLATKRRISQTREEVQKEPQTHQESNVFVNSRNRTEPEAFNSTTIQPPSHVFFEFTDENGRFYYFDQQTGKTQWDRPKGPDVLIKSSEEYYKTV